MSWSAASKWFQRSLGFVLPIAASPVPVDNLFQAGPLATRYPQMNWGAIRGGVVAAGLLWYDIGGPQRTYDVLFQRGRSGEHWQNTPKQQFEARKTHGMFVSPSERMRRNPDMRSSIHVAQRDWAREGIAWMP